ncbi:hypothetical protein ES695_07815 [Candidatus Atribacteria bacterium 1244-E10-H5-B2]|nr:MAG: hypothetical protein ES695_07815 [Candidatus Atribacteria bacterium 1244-E10-H5-B2]
MKKISELNVSDRMKIRIVNKEIYQNRKKYLQELRIDDPRSFGKIKKARREYYKKWRLKNPDYNKLWLRKWHKKHPEKQREYQIRYWLKRALLKKERSN